MEKGFNHFTLHTVLNFLPCYLEQSDIVEFQISNMNAVLILRSHNNPFDMSWLTVLDFMPVLI